MNITKIRNRLEKKASLKKVAGPLSKSVKTELSVIKNLLKNDNISKINEKYWHKAAPGGAFNFYDYYDLVPPLAKLRMAIETGKYTSPRGIVGNLSRMHGYSSSYNKDSMNKLKFYERLGRILGKKYDTLKENYGKNLADSWTQDLIKKYFDM